MVNRDPNGVNLNPPIRYRDYYAPPAYPQFVTGDAITLNGLFKWRKEAIDPVRDAKTAPGYFSGKCGFTAELVLMGDNCQAQLGWYNVTDPTSKTPPASTEIIPFVTGKPQDRLNCVEGDGKLRKTDGFCPLAWDNRHPYDLSIVRWQRVVFPSGVIAQNPKYKGGYVAFAVIGDANGCPQNKFSMYEHNQRNDSSVPWVTSLIYQSTVDSTGFYFAFEDRPMPAADWKMSGADGDFNDLVFYVSGLTCPGGNQPCDTGQFGACAVGRTDCAAQGQVPACRPVTSASSEICDNVDNDCDGVIDNGAGLCPDSTKPVCFQGACVASCKTGGFSCPLGMTCDNSGRCVEPTCAAVSCQPGMACRNGVCVDACSGVTCPWGSRCELGQCVDPCVGVSCSSGRVCDQGVCVDPCSCAGCATGLTCGSDGRCADTACANVACPAGKACKAGACVDPCAGITCPSSGVCSNGICSLPTGSAGQGGTGGLIFGGSSGAAMGGHSGAGMATGGMNDIGAAGVVEGGNGNAAGAEDDAGSSNASGGSGTAGAMATTGGSQASGGTSTSGGTSSPPSASDKSKSCGCSIPGQGQSRRALPALAGLMLGAALLRRRRRLAALSRRSLSRA
jgi:hypothetical protein